TNRPKKADRSMAKSPRRNPPGISPGGPTSLAPSLPPVHPRSEAWSRTRFYIGGNLEYSMKTVRKQRVRAGPLAPPGALGEPLAMETRHTTRDTARAPRVSFVSLGCPKALVDSERIITRLRAEGYELARSHAGADLAVVNTCGFLDSAQ